MQISTLEGALIWSGAEDDPGSPLHEVRWRGINQNFIVSGGVYVYTIRTRDGELLRRDKIAGLWPMMAAPDDKADEYRAQIAKLRKQLAELSGVGVVWRKPCTAESAVIVAGNLVLAGGADQVTAFDAETGKEVWKADVEGAARGLAVASGKLFVSTTEGKIYCFGNAKISSPDDLARTDEAPVNPYPKDEWTAGYEAAAKAVIFVPMAISFVAAAVIWRFMYEFRPEGFTQIGTVNATLTALGGDPKAWLVDTGPAALPRPFQVNNFAIVAAGIWMWTGFAMVILSAGLKGISTEVLEAARVDGANEWQTFRHITLPILYPTIAVVTTTLVINALKKFDLVWVMTAGNFGTDLVATLMYKEMFNFREFGRASALAVILLVVIVPIMLVSIRRFRVQEETR